MGLACNQWVAGGVYPSWPLEIGNWRLESAIFERNRMSTQTIKQPLVGGISTGRGLGWLKQVWARLLLGKKKLLIGGGFMAAIILAGFYFWSDDSSTPPFLTVPVEGGKIRNTITATGAIQAVTTVQVGSQASGTISALYADFNSTVKKGQVSHSSIHQLQKH